MKKSITSMIALVTSSVIFAQQYKDPQKLAVRQADKMKTYLQLNDTQYASIKKINEEYATKLTALRADEKMSADKLPTLQALREQRAKDVSAVLTKEQQQKWNTFRAERKVKMKERHDQRRSQREAEMKATLSLTDDQALRMKQEQDQYVKNIHAVTGDKTLSKEEKESRLSTITSAHESSVKAILNTDQFEKWIAFRAARMRKRTTTK